MNRTHPMPGSGTTPEIGAALLAEFDSFRQEANARLEALERSVDQRFDQVLTMSSGLALWHARLEPRFEYLES